tara:strand:- start:54 stop:557 length:504 start_codon:yes stop_codon:yes gene_type:complete
VASEDGEELATEILSVMSRQISDKKLHDAFVKGELGTDDSYPYWTIIWALRSKIWRKKGERKVAKEALGELVFEAIDLADLETLQHITAALEAMLEFERSPAFAVMADVFFAVEELNSSYPAFSKEDLLRHLNKEMQAVLSGPEVETALEKMEVDQLIPDSGKFIKK